MAITSVFFILATSFAFESALISEVFTIRLQPKALLLDRSLDSSSFELKLIQPPSQSPILGALVSIDHRPTAFAPLQLSKANFFLSKREILNDVENRITKNFQIPDNLYSRVSFWFDIYTRYDSNKVVFHDVDHPWITYKVVDVSPILEQKGKHRWTKHHESQRLIKKTRKNIKKTLLALSKKTSFKRLSTEEREIFKHYSKFKNPKAMLRGAANRLRSQTGQKDHFEQGLYRSHAYLPEMERIFINNNLPPELTRIPLVESSFNVEAYSKVGASGVWQIMPHIGRYYGMFKNNKDLRSDVLSSTKVAAKLLKEKHSILKEWPLSITAYNHGPSGLRKAVKTVKSSDLGKILENYNSKRFGFASQNFYACFLASLYAEKYQEALFLSVDDRLLIGSTLNADQNTTHKN